MSRLFSYISLYKEYFITFLFLIKLMELFLRKVCSIHRLYEK